MKEEWRYIPGCEGRILVSSFGRCRHAGKDNISKGTRNNRGGYYVKHYTDNAGNNHHVLMSRLVATVFIPNPENKPQVDHIDGNVSNNRVDNLKWVYPLENMRNSVTRRNRKEPKLFTRKKERSNIKINYPNGKSSVFHTIKQASQALGCSYITLARVLKGDQPSFRGVTAEYEFKIEQNRLF